MSEWTNLNKLFREVGIEQGVEPGTPEWNQGGILPYSGTTGGHEAYGWRHDHKLSVYENWPAKIIANYTMRPCFYTNAPARLTGYGNAGRPVGYTPELPGDLIEGGVAYFTSKGVVIVTGPDILHFQMGPLFALHDAEGLTIKVHGADFSARSAAKVIISMLMSSLAGQVTKSSGAINPYVYGDRGSSLILGNVTEAIKRVCVNQNDREILASYIEQYVVTHFEKAPGLTLNQKPALINGKPNCQLYNGLYWLLPRFYDAYKVLLDGELKQRLYAIIKRWSQYMLDLETFLPGKSTACSHVTFPSDELLAGTPIETWAGKLTVDDCILSPNSTDWSLWGLRAQYVAAEVLQSETLKVAAKNNCEKWKAYNQKNPYYAAQNKAWMTDANNEYL